MWNDDHGYDATMRAFDSSMSNLGMEYVDLYLIHWPCARRGLFTESYRAMETLYREGRIRAIGVSNFQPAHLEQLLESAEVVPAVNQIELHPWLQQDELRRLHERLGIRTEAWSPLGRGQVLEDPVVLELAAAHRRTAAQIILRWHVQLGNVVIPKASSYARIRENLDVFGFSLDAAGHGRPGRPGTRPPHRLPPGQRQLGFDTMEQVDTQPPAAPPLLQRSTSTPGPGPPAWTCTAATSTYWVYEPVHATPETRTILVIHGFRGDHHGLLRIADQLPEMRLIMPDLPGFRELGCVRRRRAHRQRYGQFIRDFMAALGLGPDTVLLGHSFGSIIASHFVAANPGAVFPLILVNPIAAPALEGPKGIMTKLAVLYYEASARLPRALGLFLLRSRLIVRVMSVAMAKPGTSSSCRFIHGQHNAYFSAFANRDSLLESFKASVGSNVSEVARKLTLPVLLVAGEKDEIAMLPDQHKLAALLPDGTLHVIPGVGHLIHYETPEPAAGFIRNFLKDHPA